MESWERWESGEVGRMGGSWYSRVGGQRVSSRFHLFVYDVNQGDKGVFLRGRKDGKTLFRSSASC